MMSTQRVTRVQCFEHIVSYNTCLYNEGITRSGAGAVAINSIDEACVNSLSHIMTSPINTVQHYKTSSVMCHALWDEVMKHLVLFYSYQFTLCVCPRSLETLLDHWATDIREFTNLYQFA